MVLHLNVQDSQQHNQIGYMGQKQKERLEFKVQSRENQQKIGAKKMINPLSLIPASSLPSLDQPTSHSHGFQGTFVDDYLLADNGPQKGKKIIKPDKRPFYKTRMCPHGRDCKRMLTCNFAHTEHELRKPFMKRKTVCKLYQMGKCHLGSACREYHGNMDLMKKNYKYKEKICKDFLQGKCGKSDNVCIYIHEMPKEEIQPDIDQQSHASNEEQMQENKEIKTVPNQQMIQPKNLEAIMVKQKNQVVEVIEKAIGQQKFVEDGLSFNFNFN